jgi:hypothetical protein
LDSDPEISAAFGAGSTDTAASPISDDPEIHAAFAEDKDLPARSSQRGEITTGPKGFINGVAELAGKSVLNIPHAAAHGAVDLWRRATGGDTAAPDPAIVEAIHAPLSANAKDVGASIGSGIGSYVPDRLPGDPAAGADVNEAATFGSGPTIKLLKRAAPIAADVASIVPLAGAGANLVKGGRASLAAASEAVPAAASAQDIVNTSSAAQSMGAAGVAPDVSNASPELQAAIKAKGRTGAVNPDVLQAHLEADQHGIQLMKGQATRDPEQFTAEQNSTNPDIVSRINKQNDQMVDAIDTIRREASPTTVGNDYIENGRQAVDALKAYDEPIKADIQAKYKALTDANGGSVPIDTGAAIGNIDAALKKQLLTKTAANNDAVSEVLDHLRSGQPLDFESFEAARTNLAGVMRGPDKSARAAAGIVRNELEQMPLAPGAQNLKGLADTARAAAKSRFDALEADPAYKSAVDDAEAGNQRGSPSPLADTFLDKYALSKSAPKSQVDLMMQKINAADPDAAGAVASHALNAVRKAAVNPNGNVLPNGYNGAIQKLGPKLDSLITPETKDSLESLGRTITRAKVEPAGGKVNYSRSGVVARDAIQGAVEGLANAKTGGMYGLVKKMLPKDGAFAKDALAPGAGLDQLKTAAP